MDIEAVIRTILEDFYDRVFSDLMIGFYFEGKDKSRLIEKELELTLSSLGLTEVTYSGLSMAEAHGRLRIPGGHFDRRLQILKETLATHAKTLPMEISIKWLAHTEKLRPLITGDKSGECDHKPIGEKS